MMFNDEFGPYAWGGSRYLNRDGVSKIYRVTWEPPWGYSNMGVIAHEMGHGFGLPHSNNADGDSSPYDNTWDVMSDSWYYVVIDSTYGKLGKGTIAYHRDMLGWIDAARKLTINSDGIYDVTVDHLTLDTTSNLRLVKVHIPGLLAFLHGRSERPGELRRQSPRLRGHHPRGRSEPERRCLARRSRQPEQCGGRRRDVEGRGVFRRPRQRNQHLCAIGGHRGF